MFWYSLAIYFYLARKLQSPDSKTYPHSIIHCITAAIANTYILFWVMNKNILSSNVINDISLLSNTNHISYLRYSTLHSLGYFVADTLDILIDYYDVPRKRVYLLHHLFSIAGISTLYWNSYLSTYALWSLEIGGIVYHLKYYANESDSKILKIVSLILYHVVYVITRILVFNNTTKYAFNGDSLSIVKIVNLGVGYGLLVQNGIWWVKNIKKSLSTK